jgi:hypothetical protein
VQSYEKRAQTTEKKKLMQHLMHWGFTGEESRWETGRAWNIRTARSLQQV